MFFAFYASLSLSLGLSLYYQIDSSTTLAQKYVGAEFIVPLFISTVVFSIPLYFKLRNSIVNQIMFSLISVELIFLLMVFHLRNAAIVVGFLCLGLYPFIFFLEGVLKIINHVLNAFRSILAQILNFLRKIFISLSQWYQKNRRLIWFIFALILGVLVGVFLKNIFISVLIILIVMIPHSRLSQKETTPDNFRGKVIYSALIYTFFIGAVFNLSSTYLQMTAQGWMYPFAALIFLAAFVWAVRYAEELYNLSVKWRILSSVLAILDFIILLFVSANLFF